MGLQYEEPKIKSYIRYFIESFNARRFASSIRRVWFIQKTTQGEGSFYTDYRAAKAGGPKLAEATSTPTGWDGDFSCRGRAHGRFFMTKDQ